MSHDTSISAHHHAHEAPLENVLRYFRYKKVAPFVPRQSTVLDLGCGHDAYFLSKVKSKIKAGVGIDVALPDQSDAKLTFIRHDLNLPVPFPDHTFEVVVSLATLEHFVDYQKIINEMYRVLAPGGRLLLTTPSIYAKPVLDFLSYRLHLINEELMDEHTGYFTKEKLERLLTTDGFSSPQHRYFQFGMNNFILAKK